MKELAPFLLQGVLMGVDELYCHRKRELRRWERLGHPLDTLCFVLCLAFLLWRAPSEAALWIYGALAVFSCLFVTKDEWQHRELCGGMENWLHSVLFMLHPVLLIWAGWLWWQGSAVFFSVISGALGLSVFFGIYQLVFWNVWRRDQQ